MQQFITESHCHAACTVKCDILYIPDNFLTNRPKDINDMLYGHIFCFSIVHMCVRLCALSRISIIIYINNNN